MSWKGCAQRKAEKEGAVIVVYDVVEDVFDEDKTAAMRAAHKETQVRHSETKLSRLAHVDAIG